MAKIGGEDKLVLPAWCKVVIAGVMITVAGAALSTRETANAAAEKNITQDRQIKALTDSVAPLVTGQAVIQQEVKDIRRTQDNNTGKLDRILQILMAKK